MMKSFHQIDWNPESESKEITSALSPKTKACPHQTFHSTNRNSASDPVSAGVVTSAMKTCASKVLVNYITATGSPGAGQGHIATWVDALENRALDEDERTVLSASVLSRSDSDISDADVYRMMQGELLELAEKMAALERDMAKLYTKMREEIASELEVDAEPNESSLSFGRSHSEGSLAKDCYPTERVGQPITEYAIQTMACLERLTAQRILIDANGNEKVSVGKKRPYSQFIETESIWSREMTMLIDELSSRVSKHRSFLRLCTSQ